MNDETIVELYNDPRLRVNDIAQILDCSRSTVNRHFKRLGLPARYAIPWNPPQPATPEIGYFLGAWITDGNLVLHPGQTRFHNTKLEFLREVERCAQTLNLPKLSPLKEQAARKDRNPLFAFTIYSKNLAIWIDHQFGKGKTAMGPYILTAPHNAQLSFLAGAIDGDGHVTKEGCIRIRNAYPWISDLPQLCARLEIRTTGPKLERILPSGKHYCRVQIHRSDFLDAGGFLIIQQKQWRLLHPEYRKGRVQRYKKDACPACGKEKSAKAKLCITCFWESDELHQHLRSIAKRGNIAGNIARWGKSES